MRIIFDDLRAFVFEICEFFCYKGLYRRFPSMESFKRAFLQASFERGSG
jgi:hypothetical protein